MHHESAVTTPHAADTGGDDGELLRRFAERGSEEAFAELVRRRIDFVYSVALRQTGGDRPRAEDATQAVFTDLARKARTLAPRPALLGWLHRSARFAAAGLVRAEQRRLARRAGGSPHGQTSLRRPARRGLAETAPVHRRSAR